MHCNFRHDIAATAILLFPFHGAGTARISFPFFILINVKICEKHFSIIKNSFDTGNI